MGAAATTESVWPPVPVPVPPDAWSPPAGSLLPSLRLCDGIRGGVFHTLLGERRKGSRRVLQAECIVGVFVDCLVHESSLSLRC